MKYPLSTLSCMAALSLACLNAMAAASAPLHANPAQNVQRSAPLVLGAPPPAAVTANHSLIVRSQVDLSVNNAYLADGGTVDLKAVLKDKVSNAPLSDQTITFAIDGVPAAVIKTDANGLAWVKGHKAPSNMALGPHQMEARFAGTNTLSPLTAAGSFTLLAALVDLNIDVVAPTPYAHKGDKISIQVKYFQRKTDHMGLAGQKLHLQVGNVEVAPSSAIAVVNQDTGQLNFEAVWPANAIGTVPVKVGFDGAEKLLPVWSNTVNIKAAGAVEVVAIALDFSPKSVNQGAPVTITGWLNKPSGFGLPGGSPIAGQVINFYAKYQGIGATPDFTFPIGSATTNQGGVATLHWTAKNLYSGEFTPKYYSFSGRLAQEGLTYSLPDNDTQLNSLTIKPGGW